MTVRRRPHRRVPSILFMFFLEPVCIFDHRRRSPQRAGAQIPCQSVVTLICRYMGVWTCRSDLSRGEFHYISSPLFFSSPQCSYFAQRLVCTVATDSESAARLSIQQVEQFSLLKMSSFILFSRSVVVFFSHHPFYTLLS